LRSRMMIAKLGLKCPNFPLDRYLTIFHPILYCDMHMVFGWAVLYWNLTMMRKMDPCLKGQYPSTRWLLCLMDIVNEFLLFIALFKSNLLCSIFNQTFYMAYVFLFVIRRWFCKIFCNFVRYVAYLGMVL